MKALVVYATKSGCTAGIAERIGDDLRKAGAQVDVFAAEDAPDPSSYDAVLAGSGVRAGTWHHPVRSWLESYAATLKTKPVAFFTCGLIITQGAEKVDEVRAYADSVITATRVEPIDIGLFAGWNEPKSFSMPERMIMKLMKAPQGDFRDMAAVDAWTASVAPRLGL